ARMGSSCGQMASICAARFLTIDSSAISRACGLLGCMVSAFGFRLWPVWMKVPRQSIRRSGAPRLRCGLHRLHTARMRLGDADEDRSNVEDRRSIPPAVKLGLGGTVAVVVVVIVVTFVFKDDPARLAGQQGARPAAGGQATRPPSAARAAAEKELERVAVGSFNDAQRSWRQLFARSKKYRDAKLVLFWDQTTSGCGSAAASMGPFYCGADERAYIDLGFYRELAQRFGAPGEFAQAYVIA